MSSNDWTIITVTYNSREHLLSCWADVNLGGATWIVVDNASTDDSVAVAKSFGAIVVAKDANDGFSCANNFGLARVRTRWVMFVNPDVVIASHRDFTRLAAVATANDGVVAPQLVNADGSDQFNARGLPYPAHKLANRGLRLPGVRLADYAQGGFESPTYIAWAMGAALGGLTATFRELGGWDERYFIYYEDHDIGLRSWRSGHPVILDPQVRWTHLWQRATTRAGFEPWKHELASMRKFYGTYPSLVWRRSLGRGTRFRDLEDKLWQPAREGDQTERS